MSPPRKSLQWLVVTGDFSTLQGTATIKGEADPYPFRVRVRDGEAAGQPDRFVLIVFDVGSDPATSPVLYRASGDVGGQVKIQR